ncbi:acid protease [Athelia psychrophila]|uniref:Acid protease n=1 Tax=Athelia psychrophila TaxID=1759441 RepID=A0A165Y510_9AGAM|nr:acid protease [Fibularhizoctonia sp. CBS 109695]
MANFKVLAAAIVLSFSVSALATPVARGTFITHPIKKVSAKNITATVARDQARLANFNSAATSSATVTNALDSYVAAVKVGSQTFSLIVDTGSSNTWVGANTKLNGGASTGKSISVSYGSGSFSGTEYTDTVTIGTAVVTSQSIGVASTATGFTGVDGIVGFGPVDLTLLTVSGTLTVPTFLDNLKSQGTISTEVLGVYFAPESGSDTDDANGELTFGAADSSKYTGSITYTPKTGNYWGITVSKVSYGGTSISGSSSAIVDTGTTLIYLPSAAYSEFLSVGGGTTDVFSGLAKFDTAPTGTVTFDIGGSTFSLTPAQYLIPTSQYSNFGLSGSASYSWIGNGGSSSVDFIIGQKFLENYYSIYDTTNSRVGFASRT